MAMTAQQAFDKIKAHIDKWSRPYSSWYVGITADPEARLFKDHNVSKENDVWIYQNCHTNEDAINVESSLLSYGCDGGSGGSGGGDTTSTYVYAYLKAAHTKP
jgi:hypothetical protein